MLRRMSADRRRLLGMRLRAQLLGWRAATPADAVRHMLALQSQDWFAGLWAVGVRAGATAAAVERAQRDGSIVRSWPVRGTLHWTAAEDIGWMTALTRARIERMSAARHRELELTEADFEAAEAITRDRLSGRAEADRAELLAAFDAAGLAIHGQRGPHLLGRLARDAVVVMTSRTGYALHDEWVAAPRTLDRDAALAEIALRYLTSHGPATDRDLAWWASLTLTEARAGIAAVRDRLEATTFDGVEHLHAPGLEPADGVHLLPAFDELVLGYADRAATLGDEPLERVVPGRNGMFLAVLMIDGQVAGTWRRTLRKAHVDIELTPWHDIPQRRLPAVRRAVREYGEHLGLEAGLDVQQA